MSQKYICFVSAMFPRTFCSPCSHCEFLLLLFVVWILLTWAAAIYP